MAALHAGASLVLPSIARGRISGIAERALSRQQADGTAQYECFCGECLDTAAMVSGSDGHGAGHGHLFASIEAVAEHWDVGTAEAVCRLATLNALHVSTFGPFALQLLPWCCC